MCEVPHDSTAPPSQEEAKDLFLRMVHACAINGARDVMAHGLTVPPVGRSPNPRHVRRREWFAGLALAAQGQVLDLVEETVEITAWRLMVLLDGMTGGPPLPETDSDFALYLQLYPDLEAQTADRPTWRVRVNPAWSGLDLHDLLRDVIADAEAPGDPT